MDHELKKQIEAEVKKGISAYLQASGFSDRKLTDTPLDALQVVPRKYVNISSNLSARPASVAATLGQRFYATDIAVPLVFDGTNWRNGIGSIIATN